MKSLEEQKQTAKQFFDKHMENKIVTEKDWNLFWLGWIEQGYKFAYEEFQEYKQDNEKPY